MNPIKTCPKDPVFSKVTVSLRNNHQTIAATIRPVGINFTWERAGFLGIPGAPIPGITLTGVTPQEAVVPPGGVALFTFSLTFNIQTDPPAGGSGRAIVEASFRVIGIQRQIGEEADYVIRGTAPVTVLKGCDPNKDTPPPRSHLSIPTAGAAAGCGPAGSG